MNQHWRQIKGSSGSDDNGTEVTLSAFGGTCFKCKAKGHKASECPTKGGGGGSGGGGGGNNNNNNNNTKKYRFQGKCNNCGKFGHKEADCWLKEENKDKRPKNFKLPGEKTAVATDGETEYMLCGMTFPSNHDFLSDPNVWIADTGATVHNTPHKCGLSNVRAASKSDAITMGNGGSEKAATIADIKGTIYNKNGVVIGPTMMTDVVVIPTGKFNLFSLTRMMKLGWTMGGDMNKEQAIWIEKGGKRVVFDLIIPTPKGMLFAMYMQRGSEIAGAGTDVAVKLNVQQAHERLGHCGEDLTRKTAKLMGWELSPGGLEPCQACAAGKAKQKNVSKASPHEPAKASNERIFLDIATVKSPADGPKVTKPHWRIMVDEKTQLKFSDFYESKSGMVEPTCEQFQRWKDKGKPVKFVRLDNAGENTKLQKRCESESWKLNIDFEFTARDTVGRIFEKSKK
jgi:hypothetical protein